ncbi:MAG: hypothetical protein R3B40_25555 [Polyangiales bacterium]|nr:hypothetical protein [Myxococcales bacterium]MCB9656907.1 hypothetical protein [Sandaracinaceae bacterium]
MIFVTGTKRSGTSMWMQIMRAAGLPTLGTAFPKDWGEVIRDANPGGFFESRLRNGVYHATNPDPRTGEYIHPTEAGSLVVKVFVPGLVRSDLAFIEAVVGTMREWREYSSSLTRLYAMERENRPPVEGIPTLTYVPPELEWWAENYSLVADHLLRRYPLHLVTYDEVLSDPERVIRETFGWLERGDADAALAAVSTEFRTQTDVAWTRHESITDEHAATFDEFYRRIRDREPLDESFIDQLNDTNDALRPAISTAMKAQSEQRNLRRRALEAHRGKHAAADDAQ